MSNSTPFSELVQEASGRAGVSRLMAALGFEPAADVLPPPAWAAYGLAEAQDLLGLAVVGRSGPLDALLMETGAGTGTDGVARLARQVQSRNPARLHLFIAACPGYDRLVLGTFGLDDVFRHLLLERTGIRPADLEALREMAPAAGEVGLELAIRQARALDRSRVTGSFFREFRGRRGAVADAWTGVPADAARERSRLALLFLSRLTFLYFLQQRGALAGDGRYLVNLFAAWSASHSPSHGSVLESNEEIPPRSFFRARLQPLFFDALNQRPQSRVGAALELGALPYLNGGLFEPHALEQRFPDLDLPDGEVQACFDDLLERYRFSIRDDGGSGLSVDPEILGQVFEGLMAPATRSETGSFYTPAPVVGRVVREAMAAYLSDTVPEEFLPAVLDGTARPLPAPLRSMASRRLERVRVLDPACGSGAFLLGALHRLSRAVAGLEARSEADVRRELVARSLHGVDLLDDAALLCSLRLWLALAEDETDRIQPLPNLDRRIRQGDALVDPLDLGVLKGGSVNWQPLRDPDLRRALRALEPATREYTASGPEARAAARARVQQAETRLAQRWVQGLRTAGHEQLRRLKAMAADRDLFGDRPESARAAARATADLEKRVRDLERISQGLDEHGALPFFSFGVHFAEAGSGFDFIVSNPPWVRSHRWPAHLRTLAGRFEVCRAAGWRTAAELTGAPVAAGAQVDLALLFIERSLRLLAAGGVLAMLVPAKAFRALYAGAARRMLLRDLEFTLIEDHGLDQRAMFRADAFAGVFVGQRTGEKQARSLDSRVRVRMTRPGVETLEFRLPQSELPLLPGEPASPWLLAPPPVRSVFRHMQAAGPPLGRHPGLRVRRGIMTGANDILVFSEVEPKLGGLSNVEAEGHGKARRMGSSGRQTARFRALVETAGLRPLVRGAGVDAFRFQIDSHVTWCYGPGSEPREPEPRMARYLERHRTRLEGRDGYRRGMPLGAIFRLVPQTLGAKVAWHDLSDTLRAVALPPVVRFDGEDRELVPLNTVYFLPTPDRATAVALAGLLNSLPVRTLARAMAERAKDARFRFFAWTVSALPLAAGWAEHPTIGEIRDISAEAHDRRGIDSPTQERLDHAVARLYGLNDREVEHLTAFDEWLRGIP